MGDKLRICVPVDDVERGGGVNVAPLVHLPDAFCLCMTSRLLELLPDLAFAVYCGDVGDFWR